MKKLLFCSLLLLRVLISFAEDGLISYSFKSSVDHKSATLKLRNVSGERVTYSIKDMKGTRFLHKMIVDVKSANEVVNFSYLPQGDYLFIMELSDRRVIKTFSINEERKAIMTSHKMLLKHGDPFYLRLKEKKLEFVMSNKFEEEYGLEILDENGLLVYSTSFIESEIKKRFNLEKLKSGVYTLKLEGDHFNFEDTLEL
ncbi:T9SS type A sorting domain-containing protein [Sediminitomix flava]|uniref:Secreted protein (Por secretion system target) n=1 Tax=Sediminitomix flava TaxID=379075 RepID=A0A315Z6H1_SEDFL|nr:hypothetical protein [Sediminitomix flava]PWJ40018.1 hypothetical protein BC781_10581 [Sediminitomix flava]